MWEGLRQTGADKLDNPTVLEPSAGSGRFLEMQPRDMAAQSNGVEVEPNPLTYLLWVYRNARVVCPRALPRTHGGSSPAAPRLLYLLPVQPLGLSVRSIVERRGGLLIPMSLYRLLPAELMPMSTA